MGTGHALPAYRRHKATERAWKASRGCYRHCQCHQSKLWTGHKRRKREHALKGNGFGYSLFNKKSKYTSTISARYYKDGSEILIEQKNIKDREDRPRKLHPIEAARLQGYPIDDWYKIPVSDNQAYKQLGNSVSVPVVQALTNEIIKQLLSNEK